MLTIEAFVVNMVEENCYVVFDETNEAVIIDCGALTGGEQSGIDKYISDRHLTVRHLLCTHGHFDHVFGNAHVYERYGLQPEMHRGDEDLYRNAAEQVRLILHRTYRDELPAIGKFLQEKDVVRFGAHQFEVIATPGHTQGGVCFYCQQENVLFSGDSLFLHSIGRTDLPGGNGEQLVESLTTKILTLPPETVVYPGHGPATTIGEEQLHNPYLP